MTPNWMEQLAAISTDMNNVRLRTDAVLQYNLVADGIAWSDEYPSGMAGRTKDFEVLKLLFRYRTTLLVGEPFEPFRQYWFRALELFPDWAGFAPKRLIPSDELIDFYKTRKDRDLRHLERILRLGTRSDNT
ncbi:MAG TPA: hypothetical protein VFE24_14995 [Pirellulales bacterium]|jgi:hypothetical protein|nr:hypothetical protein [Pirellulales bacterium]